MAPLCGFVFAGAEAPGGRPGGEVLLPALTFVATGNAVIYFGGHPVLMHLGTAFWRLDSDKVADCVICECEVRDVGIALGNRETVVRELVSRLRP